MFVVKVITGKTYQLLNDENVPLSSVWLFFKLLTIFLKITIRVPLKAVLPIVELIHNFISNFEFGTGHKANSVKADDDDDDDDDSDNGSNTKCLIVGAHPFRVMTMKLIQRRKII
jgi:hypothetical protein